MKFLLLLLSMTYSGELISQEHDSTIVLTKWQLECVDSNGIASFLKWTNEGKLLVCIQSNSNLMISGNGTSFSFALPKLFKAFNSYVKQRFGDHEILIESIELLVYHENITIIVEYYIPSIDVENKIILSTTKN
jgi:hypothetical protein